MAYYHHSSLVSPSGSPRASINSYKEKQFWGPAKGGEAGGWTRITSRSRVTNRNDYTLGHFIKKTSH